MDAELRCRLLPRVVANGAWNMAADETLLESAVEGTASLRLYGWSEPTVSLGYFQPVSCIQGDLAQLPIVRRASGGDALVHHHEVTYCLALPPGNQWQAGELRMHDVIAAALRTFGIDASLHRECDAEQFDGVLCFQHFAPCDVMVGNCKVAGSARRKRQKAVMQHGGILLRQSEHAPSLPGIFELSGKEIGRSELVSEITRRFESAAGWRLVADEWTDGEKRRIDELAVQVYGNDHWNRKR